MPVGVTDNCDMKSWLKTKKAKYILFALGLVSATVVFVLLAQWSQQNEKVLIEFTNQVGVIGVITYITVTALSIIVAPLGTGFLLPVAANSYGPFLAAVYSIVGWTSGSLIVFFFLRQFREKAVKHSNLIDKITQYESSIPPMHYYFLLILLRTALPVDVLSYALGFASSMSYKVFFLTTLIGVTPMTFLFTYSAVDTVNSQIAVGMFAISVLLVATYIIYRGNKTFITSKENK